MKQLITLAVCCLIYSSLSAQVPGVWNVAGIGGGGALFSPTINPDNTNEFYVACDMSDLFHTTDFGLSYNIIDFSQLESSNFSAVRFTNNPNIRYSINYANNLIVPVKSMDGGVTWTTLPGNPDASQETFSIWTNYNNPNQVIISYYGAIYFSNDGGGSFTDIHDELNNNSGIVIGGVFFDGNNIYLGTNDGLIESTNGGTSFSTIKTTGITHGQSINSFAAAKQGGTLKFFCLTGDSTNIYAGQTGGDYWQFLKGVYLMNNNSGKWVSCTNGIDTLSDFLMFVAMAENDTSTVCLGGGSSNGVPNVMKTADGGASWQHVFNTTNNQNIITGWCGASGDHQWSWPESLYGMAVAATNKNVVILSDESNPTKTNDGGTTWQQAYVNVADQHPAGTTTPTKQYYHSIGMENTSCWYLHWIDANNMFAGYTDIYGIRSKDGGQSWAFDYTAPSTNTIYCLTKNISNSTLYSATSSRHDMYESYVLEDNVIDAETGQIIFSTDNGATWNSLHNFGHPVYWLATDPNDSERMYASVINHAEGVGGIWVTNNLSAGAASTWTQLAAPPRTEGHPATITVLKNGQVLCSFGGRRTSSAFTESSGVFIYDPSNSTWTDKSDAGEKYWSHDVIIDPNDATQNTWYCGVFSGWGGPPNGLGGLYKTTNAGTSWTRIFNSGDVSSCAINPNNPNEMFVATGGTGLWYSENINDPTPVFNLVSNYDFGVPERIFFNPFDPNKIWVASFGHGMQWGDFTVATGISEQLTVGSNQFSIYPNPAADVLNFQSLNNSAGTLQLINIMGQVEYSSAYSPNEKLQIQTSTFARGMYFIKTVEGKGVYTRKVTIQ